jgi:hypothetical protein
MNYKNSQAGFTPIHLLSILVLIGIIGFTGWRVYDAGKSTKSADSSSVVPIINNTPKPQSEQSNIPEGFVEYKDEKLNLTFIYPKTWKSDVGVETYPLGHVFTKRYLGSVIYEPEAKYWVFAEDSEAYGDKGTKADVGIDYKDSSKTIWRFGFGDAGAQVSIPTFVWDNQIVQITTPVTCDPPACGGDGTEPLHDDTFKSQYDTLLSSIKKIN